MTSKVYDTDKYEMRLINQDVVQIYIKPYSVIELEDAKEQYKILLELTSHLTSYCILVFSNKTNEVSNEAKDYAADPKLKNGLVAEAIVTDEIPHLILGKIYTRLFKPAIPIRLFRNADNAKAWLFGYSSAAS